MENKKQVEGNNKNYYTFQEYLEMESNSVVKEPAVDYNKKRYTIEEYLEMERASDVKHEYYQGEIFAMAGAGMRHNRIFSNVFGKLSAQLEGKPCQPFGSDMRMYIPENTLFTYPDISIYCGDTVVNDSIEEDTVSDPTIIIEILSPSTSAYYLGKKFELYRDIPTLKEYILIDTENIGVKAFRIIAHNHWKPGAYKTLEETVLLPTVGASISMKDIYKGTLLVKQGN